MKQTVEEAARIEREKVILELHDAYRIHKDPKHYVTSSVTIQKYAVHLFKKGADWQSKQSSWISVEERLPKDFKPKLILLKDGKVRIAILDSNYYPHNNYFDITYFWHDREANESFDLEDVVAWMPIPSFDEILEDNRDVLERIKEKGD